MDVKTELIATALRILSAHTNILPKQDPTTEFINTIFGVEPREVQLARAISQTADEAGEAVKRARTNRRFKKITQNQ